MKVGLYLNNINIKDVDLSNPEEGNPGIGGTQYNFVTLPYYFQKLKPDSPVEFTLFVQSTNKLPKNIQTSQTENLLQAAEKANEMGVDIFIWRPVISPMDYEFAVNLDTYHFKTLAWAHNTPHETKMLDILSKKKNLSRFVCVAQEQMDRLRDHKIFQKTICIYNGFDVRPYEPKEQIKNRENIIVYLGSLIPSKGFHVLAKAWPKIIKKVPDAKLYVIGSGKLYDRNQQLGKWNVAEEKYEREKIRPYLSAENGGIHPSVYFLGVLGKEKVNVLQNALIGVPNPTGLTENCPGSAIEFQAAGTTVVSIAKAGLLDTVLNNKTGLLGKQEKDLAPNIIHLIKNKEKAYQMGEKGIEFIKEKFDHKKVADQWETVFNEVQNGISHKPKGIEQYPFHDLKLLRELLRKLKQLFPFLYYVIPSVVNIKLTASKYAKLIKGK